MVLETKLITLYGEPVQTVEFYAKFEQLTGYTLNEVMLENTQCCIEENILIELSKTVPNTVFEITQTDIEDTALSWRYTCFNGDWWYEEAKVVFDPPTEFIEEIKLTNPELFI